MNEPTAAPVSQTELEAVPASWPGAWGAYKYSKAAVMHNLGAVIGVLALIVIANILISILGSVLKLPQGVITLVQYAVEAVLSVMSVVVLFAGVDRVKMTLGETFDKSKPFILQYVLLMVLSFLIILASLVALIIPFFFIAPRISLAPYYLVRKNLGAVDALKASWAQTSGNVGKLYGVFGVNLVFALLMITIIGIPFALYFFVMYSAVLNVMYEYVEQHQAAAVPAEAAAAPAA